MRKCIIVVIALLFSFISVNMVFADADTWTSKTDIGGTERAAGVGFSIGSKSYIGMGYSGGLSLYKDFWEYDHGQEMLYDHFAGAGIWQWNGSAWNQLTPSNPEAIVASGSTLYGDFGEGGIWQWTGSSWNQISPSNPVSMVGN